MDYEYTNKKYYIAAYGSLVSHKSFKKTLKDRKFRYIIVKGYKRIFNLLDMQGKDHSNLLNIKKNKNSNINGVLFQVNETELVKLKEREIEYDLEEVWTYDFKTGKKLIKCLIFIDHFIALDKHNKKPKKPYFILCREAAYSVSKEFGEYWDNTTYNSNGKKIKNWLKENKEFEK